MIAPAELLEAVPVIISLVIIEGLLSVDNALAIAALASHLPEARRLLALRLGIAGAYLFRGLAMLLVSRIVANPWLKIVGAAYLVYLMASNLAASDDEKSRGESAGTRGRGFLATVVRIEVMDLALSLDNVVAAVALDQRLWVVCTGVFIGILALRFVAGFCIRLFAKFPILEKTAFLLIGFVGCLLLVEVIGALYGHPLHVHSAFKFGGIAAIIALSLLYDGTALGKTVLAPLVAVGGPIMFALDKVFSLVFWPAAKGIHFGKGLFARKPTYPLESAKP